MELGMAPTFLEDFAELVTDLTGAVGLQQDSRGARQKARAGIEAGLARGAKLIAQLDVTVANALRADLVRLGQWEGVRRTDGPSLGATKPPVAAPSTIPQPSAATPSPVNVALPVDPPDVALKVAS